MAPVLSTFSKIIKEAKPPRNTDLSLIGLCSVKASFACVIKCAVIALKILVFKLETISPLIPSLLSNHISNNESLRPHPLLLLPPLCFIIRIACFGC